MEKDKKKLSLKEIGPSKLLIMLLAGIVLIVLTFTDLFPAKNTPNKQGTTIDKKIENNSINVETGDETDIYLKSMEERLEEILAKVEGIGQVEVMITLKGSKKLIILKDGPYTQESMNEVDGEGGNRVSSSIDKQDSTVLVNSENGGSLPYVIQEIEPEVEGIVVIAEGGENSEIKTEITEAIKVLFGVGAHKVKVMKMN